MQRILMLFLCMCILPVFRASANDCTVQITGLKSNSGKCLVTLYNKKKGFPTESRYAITSTAGTIKDGKCTVTFKNITPGEYAIAVVHDENDNGKLDANFIGIPKEGIGTSNNAKSKFGPPSYEDSRFQINNPTNAITITIKYL